MADDVYRMDLTAEEIEESLIDMASHASEAWAIGERDGVPVDNTDPTFQNNSKYWASFAASAAEGACVITDPNEDGNLVIDSPSGSESGWAVRYDAAQALSDAQKAQARANISAGASNRNLLMNPFFTVNQRGVTTLSSAAFPADRWVNGLNTTTTTNANGVSITNNDSVRRSFNQNFEMPWLVGKTVTASVMLQDGTIHSGTATFPSSGTKDFVTFNGTSIRATYGSSYLSIGLMVAAGATVALRAFKLELGSFSTLANDTLPTYSEELERCKYYFERILCGASHTLSIGFADAGDTTHLYLPLKCSPKRATPTASYSGTIKYGRGDMSSSPSITGISTDQFDTASGYGTLQLTGTSLTTGSAYRILLAVGAYIDLSAEIA